MSSIPTHSAKPKRRIRSRTDTLLFVGFLATLVFVPLLWGAPRPMYWWPTQLAIQLLSLIAVYQVYAQAEALPRVFRIARPALILFGIYFFYILIAQLILGQSIGLHETAQQLLKTFCLIQFFCLTLLVIDARRRLELLVTVLVFAGTFQAVYGTLMTITGTEHIWNEPKEFYRGVATGTFVNRNHLAGYLEMTIALGIGLMIAKLDIYGSRTWRQWLRGWVNTLLGEKARIRICLILMVIGLILTRSRMGNAAFMISLGVIAVIGFFALPRSKSHLWFFGSLIALDVFILGTFFGLEELQERVMSTNLEEEQRITANVLTLGIIADYLWAGTGLGTWYTSFPEYRDATVTLFYRYGHNDYLQFTSELGVPGMLPLIMIIGLSIFHIGMIIRESQSKTLKGISLGVLMGILSILLHSVTDFNLQLFSNALMFVVLLALPFAVRRLS